MGYDAPIFWAHNPQVHAALSGRESPPNTRSRDGGMSTGRGEARGEVWEWVGAVRTWMVVLADNASCKVLFHSLVW